MNIGKAPCTCVPMQMALRPMVEEQRTLKAERSSLYKSDQIKKEM